MQELLGHKSVKTTMIYAHVLNRGGRGVISPLDSLRSDRPYRQDDYPDPPGGKTHRRKDDFDQ